MTPISLTVNGQTVPALVEPRMHLGDFLREHCRLTGTHLGCEHGVCGACTVLIAGARHAPASLTRSPATVLPSGRSKDSTMTRPWQSCVKPFRVSKRSMLHARHVDRPHATSPSGFPWRLLNLALQIGKRCSHGKGLRRRACTTSGEVVTKFQSDSSRTDSPVRIHMPSQPVRLQPVTYERASRALSGLSEGFEVERKIRASGLEDAEQTHQHRQRALDAQPHHNLGTDPEPAQVMRQPARARIELAVAQPLVSNTTRPPRACAQPAPRTARAVSHQAPPARSRSTPAGWSDAPQRPECRAGRPIGLALQAPPKVSGIVVEALRACRRCFWPELQSRLAQLAREVSPVPGSRLLTPTCRLNPISQLAGGFAGSSRPRPACSRSVGRSGERSRPPMLR